MKSYKQITVIAFVLLLNHLSFCQTSTVLIRPLTVGDTVPEFEIHGLIGYPSSTASINAFKGKWLLLDFWNTFCSSCIQDFPVMEGYQQEFNGKLQILTVNSEPKDLIDSLYMERRNYKGGDFYRYPKLPTATGDSIFNRLFPNTLVPHEVWIDPEGVVRAITNERYVTKENIQTILKDKIVKWTIKKDLLTHDPSKALFPQLGGVSPDLLKYYSAVSNNVPGLIGTTDRLIVDSVEQTVRITRVGESVFGLYNEALNNGIIYDTRDILGTVAYSYGKRVVLEITDSSRYIYNPNSGISRDDWEKDNYYCYEGIFPLEQKNRAFENMLQDLDRYFNLHGRLEKRQIKCMALIQLDDKRKYLVKKKMTPYSDYNKIKEYTYYINGYPFSLFLNKVALRHKDMIFVDDTGFKGSQVYMEGIASFDNIIAVRKELKTKYGLDLVERIEPVNVVVITEYGFNKNLSPQPQKVNIRTNKGLYSR